MSIKILPANPSWPTQFLAIKSLLKEVVPHDALIHHIGSTAVADLVAKDVIDIQITLASLEELCSEAMVRAGFSLGRPTSDHCPPGMSLPPDELAKQFYRCDGPTAANMHVRVKGRFNQRYPLLCRDYLRTHPLAAAAYGKIKQQLARHFPEDADAYYDIKDPVFDLLMSGAEDWALTSAWVQPPSD
jgi:GrpB-like predicted nucleotidyltransferase (UPF0157 family)